MARKNSKARKAKHVAIEELVAPTPEQMARGYDGGFVMDDNGRQAWAYRNTNHDPVERWLDNNRLDQRQKAAIDHMRRLWDLVGIHQRVTANYGERIAGGGSCEIASLAMIEAKQDLKRIEGYFVGLAPYWNVFVNVCRFGMAAGTAGADLGFGTRTGADRAHQIVVFIADYIAMKENF